MRKLLFLAVSLLALSCAPSRHAINMEMRHPSKPGLELFGKIITVAYSETGDTVSDVFNSRIAETFAKGLEQEYMTGEGSVYVYKTDVPAKKDSLIKILMNTGADLVFLFTPPVIQAGTTSIPVQINLCCYDGMNKDDKLLYYTGSAVVSSSATDSFEAAAVESGNAIAKTFAPQWKLEQFSIAYYDSSKWYEGLIRAEEYDWKGAMDIWIGLLDTDDMLKRAAAEYNIAVACFLLGDIDLAEKWLEKSKADNDMPTLTDALRKRIDARR